MKITSMMLTIVLVLIALCFGLGMTAPGYTHLLRFNYVLLPLALFQFLIIVIAKHGG